MYSCRGMNFYHHPVSTFSLKAHAALLEKEVEFTPVLVKLGDPQAQDEYRKIYPLGKVPVLEQADGHLIPESTIIIEYLDDRYQSGTRLIPEDRELARQVRLHDRLFDLYLNEPRVSLMFEHMKPAGQRDEKRIATWTRRIMVTYDLLESAIADAEWVVGDSFSMADLSAAAGLVYAAKMTPFEGYTGIEAYWSRLVERPSIAKVLEEVWPALDHFMNQK